MKRDSSHDKRRKNQLQMVLAFEDQSRSEAPRVSSEGTESAVATRGTESPAREQQLMEEVCGRENCKQALKRVKANKGSAGVDGMTVQQLPEFLKQHWPARPAPYASDPVLVHRLLRLLHASFRPHLTMTPLRLSDPTSR